MRTKWISTVSSLLMTVAALFIISCSSDEGDTSDLFYISSDIRTQVTIGVEAVSKTDRNGFYSRLNALEEKCNSPELYYQSDAASYMKTEEYMEFKDYIISIAPDSYYLLIEVFLKGDVNIGPFSAMFQDIVEATYPGLISRVLDQLDKATMNEFLVAYPQVCVEHLLMEMNRQ